MKGRFKEFLMLCTACLALSQTGGGQREVKFQEVKFRQVVRLPIGLQEGQLFVKVHPNGMVVAPRLLPPDANGNFCIMGEAKGGIMRVKRTGEIIAILRQPSYGFPSVNSSGYLAIHVRKGEGYNYTDEVQIYTPEGKRLTAFTVKGCPQCKHPYLQEIMGLDDKERVWMRFLSSDRTVEEDPNQKACAVAFDMMRGRLLLHIEGVWALDVKGSLRRRTKSIGGSFVIMNPETMETNEIPVPLGWDGIIIGMDSNRELIWWYCWRLDNINIKALMAFGKHGIAAVLPIPNKFLGVETGQKILSYEVKIGGDGRLYVAQCTKDAFYIFEADMSFLKRNGENIQSFTSSTFVQIGHSQKVLWAGSLWPTVGL